MIEDLNKTQIILLCLLVSFVTSMGTGIITASLLREVPQNVTQTINRVVERTVETIVPQPEGVITREVTVVVKEEDLIIDAISKNRASMVRISTDDSSSSVPVAIGVVIKKDGTILADRRFLNPNKSYKVTFFAGGDSYPVVMTKGSDNSNAMFLVPNLRGRTPREFVPISMSSENLQLGQTVIAIGGQLKESVAIGRINLVNEVSIDSNGTTTQAVSSIVTDTPLRDGLPGSVLLNLNGNVVGFEEYDAAQNIETLYVSINTIRRDNSKFFDTAAN